MARIPAVVLFAALVAVTGCGASAKSSSSSAGAGALSAEAKSAATGDIPDNQNFLTYKGGGFSIKYPEGWVQTGKGSDVTFRDKNNVVHVAIGSGGRPTPAGVTAALNKTRAKTPSLKTGKPQTTSLPAGTAVKLTYTTVSAQNPVTGKRVTLTVDRYVLASGGRAATLDLGTPVGVDNVDAYRMMARSFRFQ
jgi:hypothetical protein